MHQFYITQWELLINIYKLKWPLFVFEDKNEIVVSRNEFNYLRKKVVILSGKILIDVIDDRDFKDRDVVKSI